MRTKILSVILCMCLFFSMFGGFNVNAALVESDYGAEAFTFLRSVGILDKDIVYNPELMVDRGLFAKLAVCFSGYSLGGEDSVFVDIEESEYKHYINSAYNCGYISGVDETNFAPDLAITYEQAIKIIMTILGYAPVAQEKGGYPSGYMRVASECKIMNNTSAAGNSLNMQNAMILLYNAAHTDIMQLGSLGTSYEYVVNDGKTILTENFDIYTCEGIINRTAYTDLLAQDSGIERGMVSIGELVFDVNGTNAEDYLGYYVTLYYKASDNHSDYKTLYVDVNDSETKSEVFENIQNIEIDGNLVKYYEDGALLKKMHVSSTASFIKNGKLSAMSINDLKKIEKGRVELICNDGDKTADVVRVTEYETHIVSGVSESSGIIITQDKSSIEVDSSDNDYDFSIVRDGENVSLSEIVPESVILVAQSEGKGRNLKTILAGSISIQGVVHEKGTDTVIVDARRYKVDKDVLDNIDAGKNYCFEVDALGYIAYAFVENDFVYGYIYNIFKENIRDIGCLIFTENDRWVGIYFNDHVRLNGKRVDKEAAYDFLTESLAENKMIRYTVDGNAHIKTIETSQSIAPGSAEENEAIANDLFRKSISGSAVYKSGAFSFGGQFFVDGSTKIFLIPSDINKDKFGVSSISELVNDKSYSITAYDIDEYLTAGMVVIMDDKQLLGSSSKMLIVKSGAGGVILNEEDEPVPSIKGYWKGDLISLPVKIGDDYVNQNDYNDLKKGDIIQFTYDNKGNVINILPHKADEYGNYLYTTITSTFSVIGGTVENCNSGKINMTYTENGTRAGVAMNSSTAIYLYDKTNDIYRICDWAEIMKGDRVMAVLSNLVCREVIIIR